MLSLFNFSSNTEYIVVDFDSKRGNVIKLAGTTDEPYFCGKDVCMILELKDGKKSLQQVDKEDKKELKDFVGEQTSSTSVIKIGKNYTDLTYNEGKGIFIGVTRQVFH